MARESRRTRDERKYGTSPRLADLVAQTPPERWAYPPSFHLADPEERRTAIDLVRRIHQTTPTIPCFEATDVSAYAYANQVDPRTFVVESPPVRPPFDVMFVECAAPREFRLASGPLPWPPDYPRRFGFYIRHAEVSRLDFGEIEAEAMEKVRRRLDGAASVLVLTPVVRENSSGRPGFLGCNLSYPLDAQGCPLDVGMAGVAAWHTRAGDHREHYLLTALMSFAALTTLQFLNCKNVTTAAVEPDAAVNRTRVAGGLKPFLRYNVIDLAPLKSVLRTVGGIEANGLAKALHLVRGHFASYTPERPLFGRHSGTFWVPAHLRGSEEHGVVVSDYQVHLPAIGC